MTVQRLLGAAWATVHGPSEPRQLLLWTLDQRFAGIVPGPAPRAVAWGAIAAAAADLPLLFPAVRVSSVLSESSATAGLGSSSKADHLVARAAILDAVATARLVGAQNLILDPGVVPLMGQVGVEDLGNPAVTWTPDQVAAMLARRKAGLNAALDRVCRTLFALCKDHADMTFCLTAGRSIRSLGAIDGLEAIFEDLGNGRVAYWHDTAVVGRREQVLGEPQGGWLDRFSNLCRGCTLGDSGPDGLYLPPGAGGVDYPLLAAYLRRPHGVLAACLEFDPAVSRNEVPGAHAFLDKFGL